MDSKIDEYQKKTDILISMSYSAESLMKQLKKHKEMLYKVDKLSESPFDTPFTVKFYNGEEFQFPNNYNLSIFRNILKSAIEVDIENIEKQLEEIFNHNDN